MKQTWQSVLLALCFSVGLGACNASEVAVQTVHAKNGVAIDVIKVEKLADLRLYLNNSGGHAYQSFAAVRGELPACERMLFGMNAGMYHANYQPVGLYVAQGKQLTPLNTDTGFGNFFMQPNGVLAWNAEQAWIGKTTDYAGQNLQAACFMIDKAAPKPAWALINGAYPPYLFAANTGWKLSHPNTKLVRFSRCL